MNKLIKNKQQHSKYALLQHGRDGELRREQRQVLQGVGSVHAARFAADRQTDRRTD